MSKTKHPWLAGFLALAAFALIVRLLLGGMVYQYIDTLNFHLPWALGLQDGLFSAYAHIDTLNYPPLFPCLLFSLSPGLSAAANADFWQGVMFLLKLYPILFDLAIGITAFLLLRKQSGPLAFACGCLWLFNPSALFSSAVWGQADSLMLFFLLLTFWFLSRRRPEIAVVFFALGCLCKLQMLYFFPVCLCELLFFYPPRRWAQTAGVGFGILLAGWLPFMIGSGNPLLPFSIYFGGFSQYDYINMYAANLYGATPQLNWQGGGWAVLFGQSTNRLSAAALLLIILLLPLFWLVMKKTKVRLEAAVPAMVYSNMIFLFTSKMHERYQLPVLLLCFFCLMLTRSRLVFLLFLALSGITFLNQAIVLLHENYHGWFSTVIEPAQQVLSILNLLLFPVMVAAVTHLFLQKKESLRSS